jgi:hypothetical protein
MNGTLKKIEITDDLIMKIAREQFSIYNNKEILDEKREYIRVTWIKDAEDMLNNFNELIDIFKKINFQ